MLQPEWCRDTLAHVCDAVITTDTEGHITFLNSAGAALTGWAENDALGQPLERVFRTINARTREPLESPTLRALHDGVIVRRATPSLLISKDRKERPIDDSAAPLRTANGIVAGAVLVFREAASTRAPQRAVRNARSYADSIIATLREPFVVLDKSLRVQMANAAFYRSFGVAREQTEGRFIHDLGGRPWDIPQLRTLLEDVLPFNHAFQNFSVEHDFPAIGRRVLLLNARRLVSANEAPAMILLGIDDVTERRQSERTLQASEARYRRLFETARDGILILDAQSGEIIDANPFMVELLGYSHAEFVGKQLWEIGLFSERSENAAAFRRLQQDGYVRYEHLALETKGGTRAEVEFVSNVYDVDDRRVAQCNIRDISERMQLQRQTQEQAAALSDLHRRKDEFLAMLSHELRSPLAAIMNAIQMLRVQQASENPVQTHARGIIERQVAQVTHLVDDLLDIGRITSGRLRLRLAHVAIAEIVQGAVETVSPLFAQGKQQLSVSLPAVPIWLQADASRMVQVLVNVLTNAARYTDENGHVWLTVESDDDACVIRVCDTGIGIGPELLPHIFELFAQADHARDRAQGGLGIGLTIVQRLTELHGGTVAVSSAVGRGTEFVLRLPSVQGPSSEVDSLISVGIAPDR